MTMNTLPKLIFELSREGKIGVGLNEADVPDEPAVDPELRRREIADFPQVSEVEVVRHYMALAKLNYSVDAGFYPLGSCTMNTIPRSTRSWPPPRSFRPIPTPRTTWCRATWRSWPGLMSGCRS